MLEISRNRATGGVGLGLAISRQAILEQQGALVIANRSDGGLRAVIELPLTRNNQTERGSLPFITDVTSLGRTSLLPAK
jgi:signal transduction histidine kinase